MKTLNISMIQKTNGFYFVAMTDGSTAVLPADSQIIKEYKKNEKKSFKKTR